MIWLKAHLKDSLLLNTYLLIMMRVFGAGTGFLFWALAARSVVASDVGIASGAVSAATLFAGLAQLGLGYGLVRHLSSSEDSNGLLNASLVVSGLAGTALAGTFLAALQVWSPALMPLRASLINMLVFMTLVLSTTTTQLMHWAFLATRRLSFSLWKMSIQSVLAIILLVALLPWMPGYLAIITAYMASTVLALIVCFWPLLPIAQPGYRFSLRFRLSPRAPFASYSIVNYLADQFSRAPDTVLPLIIIQRYGASAGAYFFIVWTLGRSIAAWAGSIAESLFAEGASDPARASMQIWRSVRLGMLLAVGLSGATMLLGPMILTIYGQEYVEQGSLLLSFIAISGIPTVLLAIFVSYLRIRDCLRAVSTIMACSAGLGMLLCTLMMQVSLAWAGLGWLIAQILVLAGAVLWWRWLSRSPAQHAPSAAVLEASEREPGTSLHIRDDGVTYPNTVTEGLSQ